MKLWYECKEIPENDEGKLSDLSGTAHYFHIQDGETDDIITVFMDKVDEPTGLPTAKVLDVAFSKITALLNKKYGN